MDMQTPPQKAAVVIVDDDAAVRHALSFALETEGFEVRTYASGEALLAATGEAKPACLVLDQRLPGVSGLDLLARLRGQGVVAPAFLITTHPAPLVRARALAAGVEIVEKPLLGDVVTRKVRAAIV
ncbi:MAG TPA: response regulator [Caulobacterales bacterium]|nr:response regulator [Caulobacterales bacterium]